MLPSRRNEVVEHWCLEPACQSDPDTATNSQSVAPGPRGARRVDCFYFRCPPARGPHPWEDCMDALFPRCAGLDVHKANVIACVRIVGPDGKLTKHVRTFSTMTHALRELADWLSAQGVTHVAMESTGVFWKPVFHILEGRFTVWLVNAHHIKQVPGRKTDVKDCEWIAQLLQHGLLRPSYIPELVIRQLRDLTRQRSQLVAEQTRVANRIQKVLEDANIKLAAVASDVLGVSGRAILEA